MPPLIKQVAHGIYNWKKQLAKNGDGENNFRELICEGTVTENSMKKNKGKGQ